MMDRARRLLPPSANKRADASRPNYWLYDVSGGSEFFKFDYTLTLDQLAASGMGMRPTLPIFPLLI